MKKSEPDDVGFRLSSIIPSAVSYLSAKSENNKDDDTTLDVDEEEDEGTDEGDDEDDRKILVEQMDNITQHAFSSIYFQEMVNDQKHTFWGIKSSSQFTSL